MKVLVVDDHPANRKLLRIHLESEGYDVREAEDGVQALEVLRNSGAAPFHVIISDILMPRMDGYRLCYELRRSEELRSIPVMIFSSTYTSPTDEALALQIGADRFFRKPDALRQLLEAVRTFAGRESQLGSPSCAPADDTSVLKEYSEALILKLEKKMLESEQARVALASAHETLLESNRELEQAKAELHRANESLELRVQERTEELRTAYEELESFSYSVSHDLRGSLAVIRGFAELFVKHGSLTPGLDAEMCFKRIADAGLHMQDICDGLLMLAKLGRNAPQRRPIDLGVLAAEVVRKLRDSDPGRAVDVTIASGLDTTGDATLLSIALENLLNNAWKFTRKIPEPRIAVGAEPQNDARVFFVRDNGAGFDMTSVTNLFQPFRRLHKSEDFPGTGIGLATVCRIVRCHGGNIWAQSAPGCGATFYFTL